MDLRWDVFLGTYYYWRLIKGLPLVSEQEPIHIHTYINTCSHIWIVGRTHSVTRGIRHM